MLGLPQSTSVKRPLPKAQIYQKFELKASQRDALDADVAKMEIVNFISPSSSPSPSVFVSGLSASSHVLLCLSLGEIGYAPLQWKIVTEVSCLP